MSWLEILGKTKQVVNELEFKDLNIGIQNPIKVKTDKEQSIDEEKDKMYAKVSAAGEKAKQDVIDSVGKSNVGKNAASEAAPVAKAATAAAKSEHTDSAVSHLKGLGDAASNTVKEMGGPMSLAAGAGLAYAATRRKNNSPS